MDPADRPAQEQASPSFLRSALEQQGTVLGRHQNQLESMAKNMESMRASLADLAAQIQHLHLSLTTNPTPPTTAEATPATQAEPASVTRPTLHAHEPRLPPPERYSGEPGTCRAFLTQCDLVFQLQPATFPSDPAKVAYVITQLSGKAKEWGTSVWETRKPFCLIYKDFVEEMKKVFDRSKHGREAAREMLVIRQGRRSVSDFAIQFRTLATSSGWNTDAQYDAFLNGLSEEVKDQLITQEPPESFDDLVDRAIRIDNRLRQRQGGGFFTRPLSVPSGTNTPRQSTPGLQSAPPPAPSDVEPMQIDRTRLSPAERQRRIQTGACLYCGQLGHLAAVCPLKANAHQ